MRALSPFKPLKKIMPRSLLLRSFLILAVPIFLIQIISTFVFFDRHWDRMTDRLAYSVAGEIAIITNQMAESPSEETAQQLQKLTDKNLGILISFAEGQKIDSSNKVFKGWGGIVKRTLTKSLDLAMEYPYQIKLKVSEKIVRVDVQLEKGVVQILLPKKRLFSSSGYAFLLWMFSVSFLLLFIAMLLMRNQIRPIKRLAVAADRFGKGRDVPFFKIEGAREVRQASQAFVGMRERINRQIQQRTTMLAGVSHDLRTPLTRMKLQAAMLSDDAEAQSLKSDIEEMERMINAYLEFTKGDQDEEVKRINIAEEIEHIIESFGRNRTKIIFEKSYDDISLFLKPIAFKRCLSNLISNAEKYADGVWVSLSQDKENVTIIIDDNGSGIAEENYENVFKPFFREDQSRNRKTGGVGLGLSIAQDVVLSHGGDISLAKSSEGGLRVIIHLPL